MGAHQSRSAQGREPRTQFLDWWIDMKPWKGTEADVESLARGLTVLVGPLTAKSV